jgi:uncharacterized damage-inducible protein DinB
MSIDRFASSEAASFWRYISSTLERLVECAEAIDPEGLRWRPPAPSTNNIAVLAEHSLNNAEENLLQTLCGQRLGIHQSAATANASATAADIRRYWRNLRPRLEAGLSALTPPDLDRDVTHPRRGPTPGREVLIVVARHITEHLGQSELTRDLYHATG